MCYVCVCMLLRELSIISLVYGGITFTLLNSLSYRSGRELFALPFVVCCLFVVCIPSLFTGIISRISYESSHWLLW